MANFHAMVLKTQENASGFGLPLGSVPWLAPGTVLPSDNRFQFSFVRGSGRPLRRAGVRARRKFPCDSRIRGEVT